jgi:hypothetical protein
MMKYRSPAVTAQRIEPSDSPDYFPTPPWATRALLEHVLDKSAVASLTCLEPACGAGHMAKVLKEYFGEVGASDAYHYGYGEVRDFLLQPYGPSAFDWVITNPPFRLAERFIHEALRVGRRGVAILARTAFNEGVGRYERLFRDNPPAMVAPFSERVPMLKGRLDRNATTATSYAWFVWDKSHRSGQAQTKQVPPCRKELERDDDYLSDLAVSKPVGMEAEPLPDRARRKPEQLVLL